MVSGGGKCDSPLPFSMTKPVPLSAACFSNSQAQCHLQQPTSGAPCPSAPTPPSPPTLTHGHLHPPTHPGALRHAGDLSSCAAADFKVQPRQGDAILFWSLNHDLTVNPRALHGACPVVKGEK